MYTTKLIGTEGDARGCWKIVSELLHTDDRSAGKDAEENQRIYHGFCSFFSDKLIKIATKIRDIIASGTLPLPLQLTHAAPVDSTHFADISVEEAVRAIKNIPLKSSPLDFIPTTMLKSCADVFGPLIVRLANIFQRRNFS